MLISALCNYYDTLAKSGRLDKPGFSRVAVRYRILLTPDGNLSAIEPCLCAPKKNKKGNVVYEEVPVEFLMPKRTEKPAIDNNIPEHRTLYIFGLEVVGGKFVETDGARSKHNSFVMKTLEFTDGMNSELVQAYRAFAEKWKPSENTDNPILKEIKAKFNTNYFCFSLFGHPETYLHDDKELIDRFLIEQADAPKEDVTGCCAITGEESQPIARTHSVIRGIKKKGSSDPRLVCFDKESKAYSSYGKTEAYNSSISVAAAEKYVDALNYLLRENAHHTLINDLTMVYWADTENSEEDGAACDFFSYFCLSGKSDRADTDNRLSAIMSKLRTGTVLADDLAADGIDPSVNFYVAGLTPNTSRVSVKFVYRNSVGKLVGNIAAHQRDLWHSGLNENTQLTVWTLTNELFSPKISYSERKPPYPLYAALMESILNGSRYPRTLLSTVVQRCKTDSDDEEKKFYSVNSRRVAIIKACLNRKARFMNKQEVISMALDTENNSQAYVCGRIFALLEYAQKKAANGDLNRTIKDAYFTSACSKPSTVFPRLMQLAQHHLEKADNGGYINKLISEAIDKIEGKFPSTLSLDEQGEFIIGYYQQNKSIYTKAE